MMVEDVLAGQPLDHEGVGHVEAAYPGPHVGLVTADPRELGPRGLRREGGPAASQDGLGAEALRQLVDLPGRPGVDAIQDRRAERPTGRVHREDRRPDPADGDGPDPATLEGRQLARDRHEVGPPDRLAVVFHPTRARE